MRKRDRKTPPHLHPYSRLMRYSVEYEPLEPDELAELLAVAHDRDPDAWTDLYDHFGEGLLKAIHWELRQLDSDLRWRIDPEDVAQEVWMVFFICVVAGEKFTTARHVRGFLRKVARRVKWDVARYYAATKRSFWCDVPLTDCERAETAFAVTWGDPAPQAMSDEEIRHLLINLPDHLQRLLIWLLRGHKLRELAKRFNVSDDTIRRWIKNCAEYRRRLERCHDTQNQEAFC